MYGKYDGEPETIYVLNIALAHASELVKEFLKLTQAGDSKSFMNNVRYRYADIANKQEKKLGRFK